MLGIIAAALSALIGVMVWYLKYQTRQQTKREDKHDAIQKELREFSQGLVKNELRLLHKDSIILHKDSIANTRLNRKSVKILIALSEYLNRNFNGCVDKVNFKKKVKKE